MDKKEIMEKVKAAKSAEEIVEIAKAAGHEIPAEEAKQLYDELHKPVELSEEELDNVAGGGLRTSDGYLIVTSLHGCANSTSWLGLCGGCDHKGWKGAASICKINRQS